MFGDGIEIAGGLVGEEHGGVAHQGAGDGHALLLAAGQFGGLVAQTCLQAHFAQQADGLGTGFLHGTPGNQCRDHDVLLGGKFRQQVVRLEDETDAPPAEGGQRVTLQVQDVLPVDVQATAVRRQECAEDLQEGGLAGAGRAHDGHDLVRLGAEINPFQDLQGPETFVDVAGFDDHGSKVANSVDITLSAGSRPPGR